MKKIVYILLVAILSASGCSREDKVRTSGTDTIDNTTFQSSTYYIYGFSFSLGEKVSTLDTPEPDITIYANPVDPSVLYLTANNPNPSFSKAGEYTTENEAATAFNNLKEVSANAEWLDLAEPVLPNQVWIYRSGNDRYTKIRIISTVAEQRMNADLNRYVDYAECTFEWVHQPDGSLTFP